MKKIINIVMSFAVITLFACGDENKTNATEEAVTEEAVTEEAVENHDGHDHAEMQDAANEHELFPAPEGAKVSFGNIQDGDVVHSPLKIEMVAEGINVHPAGELIEGTGHHHIIIDLSPTPFGEVVPADENHIHFGGGQTETEIELTTGPHTLTLQFADGLHRSYGEMVAVTINVEVAAAE